MALLITYVLIALVFSFLCSIAEAVLLSVTPAYIAVLEKQGKPAGKLLRRLKKEITKPLAAILTLNTIAHTIGAAGAGAQVTLVFGSAFLGLASAVLTLLILFLSEIIPKTLGAHHWRTLAPVTAYGLRFLVVVLYPFVKMTEYITRALAGKSGPDGLSRQEFQAMAELGEREGQLERRESEVLKNLLQLRETSVRDAMTPRTVVFSLPEDTTVADYLRDHEEMRFSRIPVYRSDGDHIEGFVLRSELLLARANAQLDEQLKAFKRAMPILPKSLTLAEAFEELHRERVQIAQVVDEFGSLQGILAMEDIIETLLGLEIVDEGDQSVDMQEQARELWRKRARKFRLNFKAAKESKPADPD
jgi:CBS domain containing-hemolysin-like protein